MALPPGQPKQTLLFRDGVGGRRSLVKAHGALVRGGDAEGLHWSASTFIQHQAG